MRINDVRNVYELESGAPPSSEKESRQEARDESKRVDIKESEKVSIPGAHPQKASCFFAISLSSAQLRLQESRRGSGNSFTARLAR